MLLYLWCLFLSSGRYTLSWRMWHRGLKWAGWQRTVKSSTRKRRTNGSRATALSVDPSALNVNPSFQASGWTCCEVSILIITICQHPQLRETTWSSNCYSLMTAFALSLCSVYFLCRVLEKVDHLEKCKQELYLFRITHILPSLLSERKTGPIKWICIERRHEKSPLFSLFWNTKFLGLSVCWTSAWSYVHFLSCTFALYLVLLVNPPAGARACCVNLVQFPLCVSLICIHSFVHSPDMPLLHSGQPFQPFALMPTHSYSINSFGFE